MRVGVVDLGTNSVRLDVYELSGAKTKSLYRAKHMIRLGQGVFQTGRVVPAAMERLLDVFAHYQMEAEALGVSAYFAYGTSALRDAKNQGEVLSSIQGHTGIAVRVISGEEEARLIARGVLHYEEKCRGSFALIDIGGGSTELVLCRGRQPHTFCSAPLGVARLSQLFFSSSSRPNIGKLRSHVRSLLKETLRRSDPKGDLQVKRFIGSSGTIKTLARILKKECRVSTIRRSDLKRLTARMIEMDREALRAIPGMSEKRLDLIVPGAILLEECMDSLGVGVVETTRYALRDGLMQEVQEAIQTKPPF